MISSAEQYYIFIQEEPEQICRGNAKQFADIKPAVTSDPRTLQQILDEEMAKELAEDEYLKKHGVC
ncbi:MAG TPA: hypothetical protein PLS10_14450 [Chitinophagales bacterium]|nr:hypothetical protein [Chitinophagales bacterium]